MHADVLSKITDTTSHYFRKEMIVLNEETRVWWFQKDPLHIKPVSKFSILEIPPKYGDRRG